MNDILAASHEPQNQDILNKREPNVIAALGPFIARLNTITNKYTFMLYTLLQQPDLLTQCVAEADQVFAESIPRTKLRSLDVLHDDHDRTLRRYPIAPAVTRIADKTSSSRLSSQSRQKSCWRLPSPTSCRAYADPLRFDVTRYHEPRNEHKQRGAYAPFGVGTHTCLGAGAAELQIAFVMASLLHMVRIEAVDPLDSLPIKSNPTLTLGYRFRVRIAERRHRVTVHPLAAAIA